MGVEALVKKVLAEIGVNPDRFQLKWASAAEAPRFVKLITEFTDSLTRLGPLGQSEGLEPAVVKTRVENALKLVSNRKLRVSFGNVAKTVRKDGKFSPDFINSLVNEKLGSGIVAGLIEEGVLTALKGIGPATNIRLARDIGVSADQIDATLAVLHKQGKVVQTDNSWHLA